MGRKKSYDINKTLLIMGTVFVANGYEATSLDTLVCKTGLLRGSLYREFGSKRNMFELSLTKYLEDSPTSDITLDLIIIGLIELSSRDKKIRRKLTIWYQENNQNDGLVARMLGDRVLKKSNILKSDGEENG